MKFLGLAAALTLMFAAAKIARSADVTPQYQLKALCRYAEAWPLVNGVAGHRLETCSDPDSNPNAAEVVQQYVDYFSENPNKSIRLEDAVARFQADEPKRALEIALQREQEAKAAAARKRAKEARERAQYAKEHPTDEMLEKMSLSELCETYRLAHDYDTFARIAKVGKFTTRDQLRIKSGEIGIGMTTEAMLCSWGSPQDRNRTVTAAGERIQWIYRRAYVYSENGIITSWQD